MAEMLDLPRITPLSSLSADLPVGTGTGTPQELTQEAVLLRLSIHSWGTDRKLKEHQYEVQANKKMTRANKRLLISPELDAIHGLDGKCRDFVASRSLPAFLMTGVYLQPLPTLMEVDRYLANYIPERSALVENFLSAYPYRREEARAELRSLWDARNYPPVPELKRRFRVIHEYLEVAMAPGVLRRVSGDIFRREQERASLRWEQALEQGRALMRAEMASLVDHLVERLEPGESGKPKTFRDSLIANMEEWLTCFNPRNGLAGDAELAELVTRTRELLHPPSGPAVTAEALRSDNGLRTHLRSRFSAIKEQLSLLVIERPSRRIVLDG